MQSTLQSKSKHRVLDVVPRRTRNGVLKGALVIAAFFATNFTANAAPTVVSKAKGKTLNAGNTLAQANAAYGEKSYARAVELYRKALQDGSATNRDEVDYRIALSLRKSQKWDDAIRAHEAILQTETYWKARVLASLARLYTEAPHYGYKIGDKFYRGDDYPKTESAIAPQWMNLAQSDAQKTLEGFEKAKIQAQNERDILMRSRFAGPTGQLSTKEENDLNFDLAAWLPRQQFDEFIKDVEAKKNLGEVVDNTKPYDTKWNLPTKVLYLYNEIRELDNAQTEQSPLSLLAKGLFLRAYRQRMDSWAPKYGDSPKKYIKRPYPFDDRDAITIWEQLVREFPRSQSAPRAQILLAQTWESKNDKVKALAAYQRVLALFPRSKWMKTAQAAIQQITRRELSIYVSANAKPDEKPKFNLSTRNLKTVKFTAYKVALENIYTRSALLQDGDASFGQFEKSFGTLDKAIAGAGAPVANWNVTTQDKGNYETVSETLNAPLKNRGAYLLVAESGGIRAARVLVITDLILLQKTDRDGVFIYAANAETGQPVVGANVIIKERFYQNSGYKADIARGKSDAQGFFDKSLMRGREVYSSQTQAFAWLGDRYALTGDSYGGYGYSDNREEFKIYSYTDRPVYRPAQTVFFRQILTQRVLDSNKNSETVGDQIPAKNVEVKVTVNNPKGETFYTTTLKSSEFGTINGQFEIPDQAPLGEYTVNAQVEKTATNIAASGSNRFRVEEYKRPEFAVTVDAPDAAVRPGETVAAKINAKYYFGAPVPNATVKYTVRRSTWWANYKFPTPYDWLWNYWNVGDYDTSRRNIGGEGSGSIVKEGTVETDAQGNAEVSFTATKEEVVEDENNWWRRYSNPLYTIEAEVTDKSRRTIEGQGSVRVANQQYFAFLNLKGGFFQQGDRVQVEVRTQNANDKPQAASGKMVVYKLLPGDKEERVLEQPISVDKTGVAFWTWESDQSGQFRIAYEAIDAWNNKVESSTEVWIDGPQLKTTSFRLQGVSIVLDQRSYEEGQTLRALLVADQPDTAVLFTQEAGGDILKRQLVRIEGKSKVVEIEIDHKHVPNFSLAAALVKNYQVYQAQEEVFVPPVQQLLDISVKGDKASYKPGETGTFTVKVTDWKGRPARAEVSLALIDASLFYIQKGYAPDMRTFYYGERRSNNVNLASSKDQEVGSSQEDRNKYIDYEDAEWELPDGLGELNLNPGEWGYGYYRNQVRYRRVPMVGGMEAREMASDSAASEAMPMAAAPSSSLADMGGNADGNVAAQGAKRVDGSSTQSLAPVQLRTNFSETAFWSPAVITENGTATVKVTFPDSLTEWNANARGLTTTTQVGSGESSVETKKDLLLRLQAPRFFTERDQVTLSANVHNYTAKDQQIKVNLQMNAANAEETSPLKLDLTRNARPTQGKNLAANDCTITVKAGEETRVNWLVNVVKDGTAKIKMTAQSATESDGVEMSFPVIVHGVQRFASQSGVLRDGNKQVVNINIPKERRMGASTLNVQLNPSLAATMLDALPYLADYPYGCVEQTMSRFLPTVVAERTLKENGINLETLRTRAKAYAAESSTRPLGERVKNTGYTYPTGMPNSRDLNEMASRHWFGHGRSNNPLFDKIEMDKMTREGLQRLITMQRGDGGWGWWPSSGESDEYMSAYVVYGLATAKAAGVDVRDNVLSRGYNFLEKQINGEENLHLLAYMAHSLSMRGKFSDATQKIVAGRVYEQRERLTPLSQSLLALTLQRVGEIEKARVLVRNLENKIVIDEANGTARWKTDTRNWWHWWNNDVETTAFGLRAFLAVEPTNRLTPMLAKWLVTNARGNHWRSTKETAEVVYSLAEYVRVNKELDVDYTLNVGLNGRVARTYKVNRDNALFFDNRFIAGDLFLKDGDNALTIEKIGKGVVYWSAASEYFSLEEPITASGNEIAIKRRFFKLTRNENVKAEQTDGSGSSQSAVGSAVAKRASSTRIGIMPPFPPRDTVPVEPEFTRTELKDGDTLKSGEQVEVELTLTANNDYEYLVFEDMKAAGFEPLDVRSGTSYGDGLSSNVELRDEKVAFFVDNLPQGTRVLRYRVRAEIPGRFHALPTNGYAMYAPEVRAISDEATFSVSD